MGFWNLNLDPIEHLCPIAVTWTSEYPALVVLGLDYEYSETGNQDVIDLSGSILQAKRYMIQEMVVRRHKPHFQCAGQPCFTSILKGVRSISVRYRPRR